MNLNEKMAAISGGHVASKGCNHDSSTAHRAVGDDTARYWECDDCGTVEPMSADDLVWISTAVAFS